MRGATHAGVERGGGPPRARLARRRRSGSATGRHRLQQRRCGGCATAAGALRAWPPRHHPQRCGWTGAFAGRAFRGRTVEVAQRAERGAWRRDLVHRPAVWPAQARQSYPGPQELDHHGGLSAAARCWPAAVHGKAGSPQWPGVFARRARAVSVANPGGRPWRTGDHRMGLVRWCTARSTPPCRGAERPGRRLLGGPARMAVEQLRRRRVHLRSGGTPVAAGSAPRTASLQLRSGSAAAVHQRRQHAVDAGTAVNPVLYAAAHA